MKARKENIEYHDDHISLDIVFLDDKNNELKREKKQVYHENDNTAIDDTIQSELDRLSSLKKTFDTLKAQEKKDIKFKKKKSK